MKRQGKIVFLSFSSKTIKLVVLLTLVLILLCSSLGGEAPLASVFLSNSNRKLPVYCVDNSSNQIAISFDASWGADKTEGILKILEQFDVKATFFLVGIWVDKYPELTRTIFNYGMEIGTHSNTHPDLTKLSTSQIQLELETSMEKIQRITNQPVTLFRAPFGAYNNNVISTAESLNLQTVQWNVDSCDWKNISSEKVISNIITKVGSGSIILCHNNADYVLDYLPSVLTTLKSRGFEFVKISDLLLKSNFYIDHTGKQIAK